MGRLFSMDPYIIHPPRPPAPTLTLYVLGIVNDKVAIPHNRQVHRQVADIIPLIGVLLEAGTVVMLGVMATPCHMEDQGWSPSTSLKPTIECYPPSLSQTLLPVPVSPER